MKVTGNIFKDTNEINQPKDTIREAINTVTTRNYGSRSNEFGFKLLAEVPYSPIGIIRLEGNRFAVFSTDNTNCEIGTITDKGEYIKIINDEKLNLHQDFPIHGIAKINYKGNSIVIFNDKNNTVRVLNIDSPDMELAEDKSFATSLGHKKLDVFPDIRVPNIKLESEDNTGSLETGSYHIVTCYANSTTLQTQWQGISNSVQIMKGGSSISDWQGSESGVITDKSIKITFSNVDKSFDTLLIAVIKKINGEFIVNKIKEKPITSGRNNDIVYTYTGQELEEPLLLEEVLLPYVKYEEIGVVSEHQDRVYMGNLKTIPIENEELKQAALGLNVKYNLKEVDLKGKDSLTSKSFMPNEVYALYIVGRYTNGMTTPAYHIPGREPTEESKETVEYFVTDRGTRERIVKTSYKRYQIEKTFDNEGNLGIWYNQNETYPEGYGELTGQNVRHHKMPSLSKCLENGTQRIIELELDRFNTPTIDGIVAYEIFYAKRNLANSLIVSQALGFSTFSYVFDPFRIDRGREETAQPALSSGGNWFINADKAGGDTWFDLNTEKQYIKLRSPDLEISRPTVTPLFYDIQAIYRVGVEEVSKSGDGLNQQTAGIIDHTLFPNYEVFNENKLIKIRDIDLYSAHTNYATLKNGKSEECYIAEIENLTESFTTLSEMLGKDLNTFYPIIATNSPNQPTNSDLFIGGNNVEPTPIGDLIALREDLYTSFKDQQLVSTGNVFYIGDRIKFTGDVYLNNFSYATTGVRHFEDTQIELSTVDGIKMARRSPIFSAFNSQYRLYDLSDVYTKWYPKHKAEEFLIDIPIDQTLSRIVYNKDLQSINDLNPIFPDDNREDVFQYPYRIIRTKPFQQSNFTNYLLTFNLGDYTDIDNSKGRISNIVSQRRRLLIHTTETLYETITNETLTATELDEITVSAGDIFKRSPTDIIPDEVGYAGNQHLLGSLNFHLGYVFADIQQGKIFIYTDKITEISRKGLFNFFRNNLTAVKDNPYMGEGIDITFDEENNRILFTHRGKLDFTYSYSIETEGWNNESVYYPDKYMRSRLNLLSFKDNKLYLHNQKDSNKFYNDTPIESKISFVINPAPELSKQLVNVNWITYIYNELREFYKNKTISKIRIYNSYQDTGLIDTKVFQTLQKKGNIRNIKNTWNFNKIKDKAEDLDTSYYNKNYLVDKFFVVELYFNNESNEDFNIEYFNFQAKPVTR